MDFNELKKLITFDKYHFGSNEIWNNLSTSVKNELLNSFRVLEYRKNQILFQENGVPTGLYFLKSGKVKKYKKGLNGKQQIFYIASSGELLGYHALLSSEYYSDTTETLESCEIGFIPKDAFEKLYNSSHEFKDQMIKVMGHEYGVLVNHIAIMGQYNSRERLAVVLLLLKEKYKESANSPAEIKISRDDLANFVGTSRENLIRLLNELKEDQVIETKGRSIFIKSALALVKLSNMNLI